MKKHKALRRLFEDIGDLNAAARDLMDAEVDDDGPEDPQAQIDLECLETNLNNKIDHCARIQDRAWGLQVKGLEDRIAIAENFSKKLLEQLGALVRKVDDLERRELKRFHKGEEPTAP